MSKEEFKKFFDKHLANCGKKRDETIRNELAGLICHKCEIPMEEFDMDGAFKAKGHYMPWVLRGRRCPECGFMLFTSHDFKRYIEENNEHYLLFDGVENLPDDKKKKITKEIKNIIKEHKDRHEKYDNIWKVKHERDKKILTSIRRAKKTGKESKYFGIDIVGK